jgi:15-cis-phytoene desaturase
METRKVVIIGGGCAGLSAAHELVKLNAATGQTGVRFEVHVHERADFLGGKCASQFEPAGEGVYPGEHGFRFFPQFYQHLTATLREIPFPDPEAPTGTVFDNLRTPAYGGVAYNGHLTRIPRHAARASIDDIVGVLLGDLVDKLSSGDLARYSFHLLRFLTACRERRLQWDHISWEQFLRFDQGGYTEEGKELLRIVPAVLSAMRARDSSAPSATRRSRWRSRSTPLTGTRRTASSTDPRA